MLSAYNIGDAAILLFGVYLGTLVGMAMEAVGSPTPCEVFTWQIVPTTAVFILIPFVLGMVVMRCKLND
jgi:ACR3 family arsenite efflux pump ArsB